MIYFNVIVVLTVKSSEFVYMSIFIRITVSMNRDSFVKPEKYADTPFWMADYTQNPPWNDLMLCEHFRNFKRYDWCRKVDSLINISQIMYQFINLLLQVWVKKHFGISVKLDFVQYFLKNSWLSQLFGQLLTKFATSAAIRALNNLHWWRNVQRPS